VKAFLQPQWARFLCLFRERLASVNFMRRKY
jgi:hypothetical protein